MRIEVHLFGYLAEAHGPLITIDLPQAGAAIRDARAILAGRDPRFADPGVRAVLDDVVVGENTGIDVGQRLEFLPPLSGG